MFSEAGGETSVINGVLEEKQTSGDVASLRTTRVMGQ